MGKMKTFPLFHLNAKRIACPLSVFYPEPEELRRKFSGVVTHININKSFECAKEQEKDSKTSAGVIRDGVDIGC